MTTSPTLVYRQSEMVPDSLRCSSSVTGLNLVDPASAPKVIKTWDDRLDDELYVESGVDDDVSSAGIESGLVYHAQVSPLILTMSLRPADIIHPLHILFTTPDFAPAPTFTGPSPSTRSITSLRQLAELPRFQRSGKHDPHHGHRRIGTAARCSAIT